MLIVKPLLSVEVREQCEQCNIGEFIADTRQEGLKLYPHTCNHCHSQGLFKKPHPYFTSVNFLDFLSDSQKVIDTLDDEKAKQ